jgi:zinc protease
MMAVVVVGDVDKAAVEAMIKSHFAAIPTALSAKPRPAFAVPDQPGHRIREHHRPGSDEHPYRCVRAHGGLGGSSPISDYRRSIVDRLFAALMSARLDEIANSPNAPFLRAETDRGLLVRTAEVTSLGALVPPGGVERGLTALFTESTARRASVLPRRNSIARS